MRPRGDGVLDGTREEKNGLLKIIIVLKLKQWHDGLLIVKLPTTIGMVFLERHYLTKVLSASS